MKVVGYDDRYRLTLSDMMYDYFKEIHGKKLLGNKVTVEGVIRKLEEEKSIYLLLDNDNIPIGFMVAHLGDEYGMIEEYVVCEVAYIKPDSRSSMATFYIAYALAEICNNLGMGIRTNLLLDSSSYSCLQKVGSEQIGSISYISPEDATKIYNKYKRRINR